MQIPIPTSHIVRLKYTIAKQSYSHSSNNGFIFCLFTSFSSLISYVLTNIFLSMKCMCIDG